MNLHVAAAPAPHPGPSRDEPATRLDRVTKSGRRLWYQLTVIQQPERARACGSGPKSSADRRPVDPPPVVELRIFEGSTWQEAKEKDITFLYNANFFLYATLEHARVMAHGRVQTPAANQPPVLTGMPVSGMAYLDRPLEAGYFLFPDLSVRHEGRYRLTFNLYEETKEDKDKDPDTADSNMIAPGYPNATGGSFDFRMEIKSNDFVVFSAKKFPGLSESTQLSRCVAEQGCRVRIRRDVRMRRRDRPKDGGDYDNVEDEYSRRKRTETPEVKPNFRQRSMSGSVERTSFSAESKRRQSGPDYPPQFPQTPDSAGGHLQFFGNASQYHPHAQAHPKPSSVPPSPSHQTSHGGHYPPPVHQSPHQHLHQHSVHAQPSAHQAPQQAMQQPAYAPPPPPPQQQQPQTYSHAERPQALPYAANYAQSSIPSPQRETAPGDFRAPAPPHLRDLTQHKYRDPQPKEFILPPFPQATVSSATHAFPPLTLPPISTFELPRPSPVASVAGSKRSRDDGARRHDVDASRYHNGARENPQLLDDQDEPQLIYARADGRQILVQPGEEPRP